MLWLIGSTSTITIGPTQSVGTNHSSLASPTPQPIHLDVEFLEGRGLLGGGDPVGQVWVFLAQLVECVVDL